jgi:hypothetical protein
VVALLLAGARETWACPSCFGQADGPLIDAARTGIWLLLGVTAAVQAAFVAFFLHLRRQAARARDQAVDLEWPRLQGPLDPTERSGPA